MPDRVPDPVPDPVPDWVLAQREWLRPTVVGRLCIHPPWLDPVGEVPVSIDPGPTFGHGAHPTTGLVLAEVDRLAGPGQSVLDVGCGSGVLGIAAALLGAGPVVGIDVEDDAVAWTRANAAANDVEVSASTTPIRDLPPSNGPFSNEPGTFDLVLANVLPVVHDAIASDVVARIAEAGTLVVSGIPDEHADRVSDRYRAEGLSEVRRTQADSWSAITFGR
jgi:ribosomal protein L11 methyltransferase